MLERGCIEKRDDRRQRIRRKKIGLSRGVSIHFQFQFRDLFNKRAVRAIRVTRRTMLTAQPWTEPRVSGVKMRRV